MIQISVRTIHPPTSSISWPRNWTWRPAERLLLNQFAPAPPGAPVTPGRPAPTSTPVAPAPPSSPATSGASAPPSPWAPCSLPGCSGLTLCSRSQNKQTARWPILMAVTHCQNKQTARGPIVMTVTHCQNKRTARFITHCKARQFLFYPEALHI